jgi:hypothetical protein
MILLMPEPATVGGLILKAAVWAAGLFSTWLAGKKTFWAKRCQMRRGLYRELAQNYGTLQMFIDGGGERLAAAASGRIPFVFEDRFFKFATADMPTFHAIPEYNLLTQLYDSLRLASEQRGTSAVSMIVGCRVGIDEMLARGYMSKRLFKNVAAKALRAEIDKNVEERRADLDQMSE